MAASKGINFFLVIIALIVGGGLYRQVDFDQLTVESTGLTVVYALTFGVVLFLLIRDFVKTSKTE